MFTRLNRELSADIMTEARTFQGKFISLNSGDKPSRFDWRSRYASAGFDGKKKSWQKVFHPRISQQVLLNENHVDCQLTPLKLELV